MSNPPASSFVGGMNMNLTGSLYFPRALLNISDGSRENVMALVAWKLNFVGDSRVHTCRQLIANWNSCRGSP